jgi:hypothetical protein
MGSPPHLMTPVYKYQTEGFKMAKHGVTPYFTPTQLGKHEILIYGSF